MHPPCQFQNGCLTGLVGGPMRAGRTACTREVQRVRKIQAIGYDQWCIAYAIFIEALHRSDFTLSLFVTWKCR